MVRSIIPGYVVPRTDMYVHVCAHVRVRARVHMRVRVHVRACACVHMHVVHVCASLLGTCAEHAGTPHACAMWPLS